MSLQNVQSSKVVYRFGSVEYDLVSRTFIMGILNVTPDSFYDGGKFVDAEQALARAEGMVRDGADFIDIGGESTRPGSDPVPLEKELERVIPVIQRLVKATPIPISIDTYKSEVADAALTAGALIVNDISGLTFDPRMSSVIARHRASVILMHIKGTPKTMQQSPVYHDVVKEVSIFLSRQAMIAREAGIEQIIVDPGIGFGKILEHNLQLLRNLDQLTKLGYPLMVGTSRKSFIGKILDLPVEDRIEGTAATVTSAVLRGANIVRVHDVKEMMRVARMADVLKSDQRSGGGQ
jgi:dihydropteroate synthase